MRPLAHTALSMLLAGSVAVSAGCAAAGTGAEGTQAGVASGDCLFAVALRDWRPLDDRNLLLFGSGRRAYHVELVRPAPGLRSDIMIGVYDRDGRICPYGGDAIVVDRPIRDRITIRSIKRLSDDELDAVYVRFGILAPAVIDETVVEPAVPDPPQ